MQILMMAVQAQLDRSHSMYDVKIQNILTVEKGWLVIFEITPQVLPGERTMLSRYQRCAFFTQTDKGINCPNDIILG